MIFFTAFLELLFCFNTFILSLYPTTEYIELRSTFMVLLLIVLFCNVCEISLNDK